MREDRPPFSLRGLDHIVLRIADRERALRFYLGVVGCTLEREQSELGLIQLRAGRSLIDLVTLEGALGRSGGDGAGKEGRNLDHFCLRIEPFDLDALAAHLAQHGVAIEAAGARYGAEGEGTSVYVRDPDGNQLELKGPPS